MQSLQVANNNILQQLNTVIEQLEADHYKKPLPVLSQSSIGQHIRHILEFYQCLYNGLKGSVVNYDIRERDLQLESDKNYALEALKSIFSLFEQTPAQANLTLSINFDSTIESQIKTTFERELCYLIEHTIHHLAIIKIGVNSCFDYVVLPENFGYAYSTIHYKKQVQSA